MSATPDDIRRQAECATMLVAIAKVMLDARPAEFAAWLRSVADDIEAEEKGFAAGRLAERFERDPEPLRRNARPLNR